MDKLLLVDGHNLLFQMFYGMPNHIYNQDGKTIEGTIGFIGAILKMINIINPTHLLVVFDGEHANINHSLIEGYKANRIDYSNVEEIENPFSQLPHIFKALKHMNIKFYETVEFEADDLIANYASKLDIETVISSFDTDFIQLVNHKIKLLNYRGLSSKIIDEDYIITKYKIKPYQYVDFKSLTGDKADNIKGVLGVGPITAANLVNEYGNINNIIVNIDKIKKDRLRWALENSKERLPLNYQAIKFKNIDTLPYQLNDLKYNQNNQFKTTTILKEINVM